MKKLALRDAFSDAKNQIEREIYYFSEKVDSPSPFQFPKTKDITYATTEALEDTYFKLGRILYDPNFFEFSTKDSDHKKDHIYQRRVRLFKISSITSSVQKTQQGIMRQKLQQKFCYE